MTEDWPPIMPRSTREPKVTISVTLSWDERDELAMWAREQGVSMSTFLRWFVQSESEQRFLRLT